MKYPDYINDLQLAKTAITTISTKLIMANDHLIYLRRFLSASFNGLCPAMDLLCTEVADPTRFPLPEPGALILGLGCGFFDPTEFLGAKKDISCCGWLYQNWFKLDCNQYFAGKRA